MDFTSFVYSVVFCILCYVGGRLHERYRPRRKLTKPVPPGPNGGIPEAISLNEYREHRNQQRYLDMWKRERTGTDG